MANIRILSYGTKPADQFTINPENWRKHPPRQRQAVKASLDALGWVDVVIENAQTGYLIDGHERVRQALEDNSEVPYIQVDLTPEQERLALATLDPLTNMAETDREMLAALLDSLRESVIVEDNAAARALLDDVERGENILSKTYSGEPVNIPENFMILIECQSEHEQADLLTRFEAEGISCRAIIS